MERTAAVALRKIDGMQRIEMRPAHLYYEDLVELDELMKCGGAHVVTTCAGVLETTNIADLLAHPHDRVRTLRMSPDYKGDEPRVELWIDRDICEVKTYHNDPPSVGLLHSVAQVVRARRRPLVGLLPPRVAYPLVYFIFTISVGSIAALLLGRRYGMAAYGVVLVGSFLIWMKWLPLASVVTLRQRRDAPSWWRRNSDALTIALIASPITAIAGYLLGRLGHD